jgi:hypothetical protein
MLPKKSKSKKCEEYWTASILTHTFKILTKIILGWIEKKIDKNLAEEQFGSRKNKRHTRSYFVFVKHCREKFYSKQKGISCLCRLTESFWQCKLECNDEDTKDD